jgi:hypothetical protein
LIRPAALDEMDGDPDLEPKPRGPDSDFEPSYA